MEWIRWAWAVLALLLLVAEVFVSGFVLIGFAIGAAAASVVAFLDYSILWQVLVFVAASLLTLLLMRPLANRLTRQAEPNFVGIDRVLGKQAVVLLEINPLHARGRVRVEREEWQAASADAGVIPAGTVVTVLGVEGTRLIVRPTALPPTP